MSPAILALIARRFNIPQDAITDIANLDGTNEVYSFSIGSGEKYVIRIPAGNYLMYPAREKAVYDAIAPLGISDTPLYLDDDGVKIAPFFDGSKAVENSDDTLGLLRTLHTSGIKVNHRYGIENVRRWIFPGWEEAHREKIPPELVNARKEIDALLSRLAEMKVPQVLCHGDACAPNCLRLKDGSLRLIDWEQAGMADPLVDIAVSAVHSGLDKPELHLEHYLRRNPSPEEMFRLHAYIALHYFAWAWWNLQLQENENYHNNYKTGLEYMQGLLE
jgi:thiamine kinase-like enzyme